MGNVILIGFMGCGKSSIGRCMAKEGYELIDTDEYIENRTGRIIKDIFAEDGEQAFRLMETDAVRELIGLGKNNLVIAVGGGLPVKEENRPLLKELGTVVYLKATVDSLEKRLERDTTRPLLQGGNVRDKIETLMAARADIYDETADVYVDTDDRSFESIVEEIKRKMA